MKKSIIIFACVFMLVLSGCRSKSIGIIGGADGPTDIIVSNNEDENKYGKDFVRMVRIDGGLYYETGKSSDITARCGNLDGSFKKTSGKFEVPQNDNESNFDDADGYQIGTGSNTIEISIGGEWKIFEKINMAADILKYKYCFELSGRLPNAKTDSKYLVLANEQDISFDDAAYMFYGSDLGKRKDIYACPIID